MPDTLEHEVDRLYGLELDDFVRERAALARSLRAEGKREEAATVAALRKPTIAAWTVNQLARRSRRDVDLLLDAGYRLVEAQRTALEGKGRAQFDQAREAEAQAIERLRDAAERLLGERGSRTTLDRVEETLRAAAVSEEGRELLARGRLTSETTGTGWEVLGALGAAAPRAPRQPAGRRQAENLTRLLSEARENLREARAGRAAAARRVRTAERDQARAQKALETAEAELDAARQELGEATVAVDEAERSVKAAEQRRKT